MIRFEHDHRTARAAFTHLAEPADPLLGALLKSAGPCEALAAIRSGTLPAAISDGLDEVQEARARRTLSRWQLRLRALPPGTGPLPKSNGASACYALAIPTGPAGSTTLARLPPTPYGYAAV